MTDATRELIQRLAKELDHYRQLLMDDRRETHALANEARALLSQSEPEGPPLEPRGCPTPGACSCPTSPTVPTELIRVLELAEAALADISDAGCFQREPGDDLAQAEARAAQDLPRIRAALARWGRPELEVPTDEGLIRRLLLLAEQAVKEALDYEYGDPEDRYIWRELQELKQLVKEANGTT